MRTPESLERDEALVLQRAAGDDWGLSISRGYLGLLATVRGEHASAAHRHRESLRLRWEAAVWEDIAASLADLAALRATRNQGEPRRPSSRPAGQVSQRRGKHHLLASNDG
jgi:hypothetical protein